MYTIQEDDSQKTETDISLVKENELTFDSQQQQEQQPIEPIHKVEQHQSRRGKKKTKKQTSVADIPEYLLLDMGSIRSAISLPGAIPLTGLSGQNKNTIPSSIGHSVDSPPSCVLSSSFTQEDSIVPKALISPYPEGQQLSLNVSESYIIKELCIYCTPMSPVPGVLTLSSHALTFEPDIRSQLVTELGIGQLQVYIDIQDIIACAVVMLPDGPLLTKYFGFPHSMSSHTSYSIGSTSHSFRGSLPNPGFFQLVVRPFQPRRYKKSFNHKSPRQQYNASSSRPSPYTQIEDGFISSPDTFSMSHNDKQHSFTKTQFLPLLSPLLPYQNEPQTDQTIKSLSISELNLPITDTPQYNHTNPCLITQRHSFENIFDTTNDNTYTSLKPSSTIIQSESKLSNTDDLNNNNNNSPTVNHLPKLIQDGYHQDTTTHLKDIETSSLTPNSPTFVGSRTQRLLSHVSAWAKRRTPYYSNSKIYPDSVHLSGCSTDRHNDRPHLQNKEMILTADSNPSYSLEPGWTSPKNPLFIIPSRRSPRQSSTLQASYTSSSIIQEPDRFNVDKSKRFDKLSEFVNRAIQLPKRSDTNIMPLPTTTNVTDGDDLNDIVLFRFSDSETARMLTQLTIDLMDKRDAQYQEFNRIISAENESSFPTNVRRHSAIDIQKSRPPASAVPSAISLTDVPNIPFSLTSIPFKSNELFESFLLSPRSQAMRLSTTSSRMSKNPRSHLSDLIVGSVPFQPNSSKGQSIPDKYASHSSSNEEHYRNQTGFTHDSLFLTKVRIDHPEDAPLLLTEAVASELSSYLPPSLLIRIWRLRFCTQLHGLSFKTFFRRLEHAGPSLFLISDTRGSLFGGFCSVSVREASHYYGTGESFVFTFNSPSTQSDEIITHGVASVPSESSIGAKSLSRGLSRRQSSDRWTVGTVYQWSTRNSFFVYSDSKTIAFGGGGSFALTVDSNFLRGSSEPCPTYSSPCLASSTDFLVRYFQVWCFADP